MLESYEYQTPYTLLTLVARSFALHEATGAEAKAKTLAVKAYSAARQK